MKKIMAFTMVELLISLSLASIIMLAITGVYNGSFSYLSKSREMMALNNKACLLFHQLERDISAAFIPLIIDEDSSENVAIGNKNVATTQQDDKEKKKKSFFTATVDTEELYKIDNKKVSLLRDFSCITTGPMQFFNEEKRARIIRIRYILKKNRQLEKNKPQSYSLFRIENLDIYESNKTLISDSGAEMQTRNFLIADGIKGLYIEWLVPNKKTNNAADDLQEESSFIWGDIDTRSGVLPQQAVIIVEFWNSTMTRSVRLQTMVPIFCYEESSSSLGLVSTTTQHGASL